MFSTTKEVIQKHDRFLVSPTTSSGKRPLDIATKTVKQDFISVTTLKLSAKFVKYGTSNDDLSSVCFPLSH